MIPSRNMSYAESPATTVRRFFNSWDLDNPRLIEELQSVSNETNSRPDPFNYNLEDGKLIDPTTGNEIVGFISPGPEMDVVLELQSWANTHEEGGAIWISPTLEGVYPGNKVIVSRIAYTPGGHKVIQNSAILFDGEVINPDLKRRMLYTFPDTDENFNRVLKWVEKKQGEQVSTETARYSVNDATYYANLYRNGYSVDYIIHNMEQSGFLGDRSISCPGGVLTNNTSQSDFLSYSFTNESSKFVRNCGRCGVAINALISKGYVCSNCKGIYEGC